MDRTAEFAARQKIPVADVTHCVKVGRHTEADHYEIYAVGFWSYGVYMTATIHHNGTQFTRARVTYDVHIRREQ